MKVTARGLVVLLMLATPAYAEFTPGEKDQVVSQLKSLGDLQYSIYWALQHVKGDPTAAVATSAYMDAAIPAWEAHLGGLMYLQDLPGEYTESNWRAVLAGPRADVVAQALATIQTLGYNFPKVKIDAIPGTSAALDTAKSLLQNAADKRAAIDTTLPYLEPRTALNMSMPGATRDISPAIGPHGDYRMMGAALYRAMNEMRRTALGMSDSLAACPAWIGGARGLAFAYSSVHLISKFMPIAAALIAGIEPDIMPPLDAGGAGYNIIEHIDAMTAGGTTTRPREFFSTQFAIELLLMFTHTGVEPYDVNGRHSVRGLTYNYAILGQVWQNAIDDRDTVCDPLGEDAFLGGIADAIVSNDASWARMDDMVQHGMLMLKHFQVFPAPGPSEPPVEECPVRIPVLDILSDRIQALCVVAP